MDGSPTLVLRDAWLVDGTGAAATRADVTISGDRIAAVDPAGATADRDVDAIDLTGATVTPGFIDVHSHADNAPFLEEDDTSKILQGVTTEVVGNCGFSLAPRGGGHEGVLENYAKRLFPPLPWRWRSMAELFAAADERGYVTNHVPLVGHHALRIAALGMADRAPAEDEQATMRALLAEALAEGAFGLSTGLIYPPGLFAQPDEITDLVATLPERAVYATHMRGESVQLPASLRETVAVAERTGRRVQVSHLKVAGRRNWGSMDDALALLDAARERGAVIHQDVYPYTAGSTMLTATLPPWFQEGGEARVLERLHDRHSVERLRDDLGRDDGEWENQAAGAGWEGIVIASSRTHRFDGASLAEVAARLGTDPVAALVEVLRSEELQVSMIVHSMHDADLRLALSHPLTVIGSDGLPPGTGGRPHPRTYGTFPRVLRRYVRDEGVLGFEEAVHRMTGLPAAAFGLDDRGVVEPGRVADLVVIDRDDFADRATYEEPATPPAGLRMVFQGGQAAVSEGRWLGERLGRRLAPTQ